MSEKALDLDKIAAECREFATQFQSLQLATVSPEGVPEASYAPYIKIGRDFYVYVSELSRHTANLTNNPRASVLFIENENEAKHLFARRRLTYQCTCEEVLRDSDGFEPTLDLLEERFGKIIGMLRNLQDFHLIRVVPQAGGYVAGFARAFDLVGDDLDQVRHINDVGHRAADKKTEKQMDEQLEEQAKSA